MQEKELKTSLGQRIIIGVIAVLLLSSTIAIYALIVLNGEKNKQTSSTKKEELAVVTKELSAKQDELKSASDKMSKQYFDTLASFRNKIKAYNGTSVEDAASKPLTLKMVLVLKLPIRPLHTMLIMLVGVPMNLFLILPLMMPRIQRASKSRLQSPIQIA